MTNADATVRVLSGIGALGSIVALGLIAYGMSRQTTRQTLLLAYTPFSLGVLVYGIARMLSGPNGIDASVQIVATALIVCGALGIVLTRIGSRSQRTKINPLG